MRVKPAPGTYRVIIDGHSWVIEITEDGATFGWAYFEFNWVWRTFEGGPVLVPAEDPGLARGFFAFYSNATVDTIGPAGIGRSGIYAPA